MGPIIFGLIILVVGLVVKKSGNPIGKFKGILIAVGVIITAASVIFQTVRIIDTGTIGVKKLFGEVKNDILSILLLKLLRLILKPVIIL